MAQDRPVVEHERRYQRRDNQPAAGDVLRTAVADQAPKQPGNNRREQRQENAEFNCVLKAAQREFAETQKSEVAWQSRIKKVQENYTASVAENSTLRNQARTIPADVGRIVREHEQLIKENADMHYNLGVLFAQQKEYTRALSEFRKVVELRPNDADAYYNLGVIYAEHLPDREKAMAHFRRYLTLKPGAKDSSWVKQYIASWRAWEVQDRLE